MAKPGRDFEDAVHQFVKMLSPDAQVLFNAKIPDRDTGSPRQVDVWVQYTLLGNVPVSILISCKDHRRPLDVGEIETFISEIRSTGAAQGVLYSRGRFTEKALVKAKANNVSCCRLFDDAPPELPSELIITTHIAHPVYRIAATTEEKDFPTDLMWRDILDCTVVSGQARGKCVDMVFKLCRQLHERSMADTATKLPGMTGEMVIKQIPQCPSLRIHGAIVWDWFEGGLNALRLTGSLNVNTNWFVGSAKTTEIPIQSTPSLGTWKRCPPPDMPQDKIRITINLLALPFPEILKQTMGPHRVFGTAPFTFGSPDPALLDAVVLQHLAAGGIPPTGPQHLTISIDAIRPAK